MADDCGTLDGRVGDADTAMVSAAAELVAAAKVRSCATYARGPTRAVTFLRPPRRGPIQTRDRTTEPKEREMARSSTGQIIRAGRGAETLGAWLNENMDQIARALLLRRSK